MQSTHKRDKNTGRRAGLIAALAYLAVACMVNVPRSDVAPQSWWEQRGPVVPHDSFPMDCTACHLEGSWDQIRADFVFDHGAETGVVLEGAHAQAECLRCHNDRGPVALYNARGCSGCHEDIHLGRLGKGCESCHEQHNWQVFETISQHNSTRFPLVGAHAASACWRCHPGAEAGQFTGASTECAACHQADLDRALSPAHKPLGWVNACDRCHIPTRWDGAGFLHNSFPLTGAHRRTDCVECHVDGQFTGLPRDCAGCHMDDYQMTTDPNHVANNFPTACDQCHTTQAWEPANFSHAGITNGCVNCHLSDYQNTTRPNHTALGYSLECQSCHGTDTWSGANFSHNFPINGGDHGGFNCTDCHTTPSNFTVFTCTDCHAHQQGDMADEHNRVGGYVYQTSACYACHPDGDD
ncbi:MAG: hypothetical protein ACI8QC_000321 [Planctomycetota bacterium]|jgi:hypothetical protein